MRPFDSGDVRSSDAALAGPESLGARAGGDTLPPEETRMGPAALSFCVAGDVLPVEDLPPLCDSLCEPSPDATLVARFDRSVLSVRRGTASGRLPRCDSELPVRRGAPSGRSPRYDSLCELSPDATLRGDPSRLPRYWPAPLNALMESSSAVILRSICHATAPTNTTSVATKPKMASSICEYCCTASARSLRILSIMLRSSSSLSLLSSLPVSPPKVGNRIFSATEPRSA